MGLLGPIAHFVTPIPHSRSARSNQRAWMNRANETNPAKMAEIPMAKPPGNARERS
jgi:hypothetical protein